MGDLKIESPGKEKGDLTVNEGRGESVDAVEDDETCT